MAENRNPADNIPQDKKAEGGRNSGGNFANDPERAAEAGRKGGQASQGGSSEENR